VCPRRKHKRTYPYANSERENRSLVLLPCRNICGNHVFRYELCGERHVKCAEPSVSRITPTLTRAARVCVCACVCVCVCARVCVCVCRTQPARSATGPSPRPTTAAPWASSSCTTSPTRSPSAPCRTGESPEQPGLVFVLDPLCMSMSSLVLWGVSNYHEHQNQGSRKILPVCRHDAINPSCTLDIVHDLLQTVYHPSLSLSLSIYLSPSPSLYISLYLSLYIYIYLSLYIYIS